MFYNLFYFSFLYFSNLFLVNLIGDLLKFCLFLVNLGDLSNFKGFFLFFFFLNRFDLIFIVYLSIGVFYYSKNGLSSIFNKFIRISFFDKDYYRGGYEISVKRTDSSSIFKRNQKSIKIIYYCF